MVYYVIIRGPVGVGKSVVAKSLAKQIEGVHISIDRILEEENFEDSGEDGFISHKGFLKANEFAANLAKEHMKNGKSVIFDGSFYWKSQIDSLIEIMDTRHYVFTLKADFDILVGRDDKRESGSVGKEALREGLSKISSFYDGFVINTNKKNSAEVVGEILFHLK
jgi:adenylate kinase family enzyme